MMIMMIITIESARKTRSHHWYAKTPKQFLYTYHREDGPAVITDNSEGWYRNGSLHRINGPASTYLDNQKNIVCEYWYEFGTYIRQQYY
jgi:hypothetical protein